MQVSRKNVLFREPHYFIQKVKKQSTVEITRINPFNTYLSTGNLGQPAVCILSLIFEKTILGAPHPHVEFSFTEPLQNEKKLINISNF